ncbi:MAG: amino acid aminotransferase [Acidobacteriota bacterium]
MSSTRGGSHLFRGVSLAPPDPILSLSEDFRQDPRSHKLNLGVGVYANAEGATPVLEAVKAAERRLVEEEGSKSYLPIPGDPAYGRRVRDLVLGADHPAIAEERSFTVHTPGGTGALRVFFETVQNIRPGAEVWYSNPTWVNHQPLLEAVGLNSRAYPYFDATAQDLAFDAMVDALGEVSEGDLVLFHGCCHNPSGVDLQPEHWPILGELLARRGALPVFDFAYQGFGEGLEEDRAGILEVLSRVPEAAVCSSFSKNLGLYRERVGALTVVTAKVAEREPMFSQVKRAIRSLYSSPPSHGGAVVARVLTDPAIRGGWLEELSAMRYRIEEIRRLLASALDQHQLRLHPEGNDFIIRQRGMFSFTGLSRAEVVRLREEQAVYMVNSGRINVAALNPDSVKRLVEAIAAVRGVGSIHIDP